MKTISQELIDKALLNPNKVFSNPVAVINTANLSNMQKIEILKYWEYDIRGIEVAVEEGFPTRESEYQLDTILDAMRKLGARLDRERSAPTKQGGV